MQSDILIREAKRVLYTIIKRSLDIALSLLLLCLFSPLFLIITILIRADSSGPAIFRQVRCGKNGKPFIICKFRTMFIKTPQNVPKQKFLLPYRYITPFGKFLRQTSLDELPQLLNVLKGDMSFVGPRPVIPSEKDLIRLRHQWKADTVRPGITGLAQIRGRDLLNTWDKAQYDAQYALRCSFGLDVYILFSTIKYVIKREDIREGRIDL